MLRLAAGRCCLGKALLRRAQSNASHPCLTVRSAEEMKILGSLFAKEVRCGDTIYLNGDLGVGKSCFAQGLIRHYFGDPQMDAPSPTFLIDQCYEAADGGNKAVLHHMDFYRFEALAPAELADSLELLEVAHSFENDVCLVEWSQFLHNFHSAPETVLRLDLEYCADDHDDLQHPIDLEALPRHISIQTPIPDHWGGQNLRDPSSRLGRVLDDWANSGHEINLPQSRM